MSAERCRRCGADLSRGTRFCGACGAPTAGHVRSVRRRHQRRSALVRRHALGVGVVFVGTLAALIAASLAAEATAVGEGPAAWLALAANVGVGFAACAALGRGEARASLAGPPPWLWLALAPLLGALSYGLAAAYVDLVVGDVLVEEVSTTMVLAIVLGAPLVEEWLDRGVLWRALEPLTSRTGQVLVGASLFALVHGLGGGFVLELPHRFAGGVVLGLLRAASGSLVPCVVAHATWNGLAVALAP